MTNTFFASAYHTVDGQPASTTTSTADSLTDAASQVGPSATGTSQTRAEQTSSLPNQANPFDGVAFNSQPYTRLALINDTPKYEMKGSARQAQKINEPIIWNATFNSHTRKFAEGREIFERCINDIIERNSTNGKRYPKFKVPDTLNLLSISYDPHTGNFTAIKQVPVHRPLVYRFKAAWRILLGGTASLSGNT